MTDPKLVPSGAASGGPVSDAESDNGASGDAPFEPAPGKGPTEWFEARVGVGPWEVEHPGQPRPVGEEFDQTLLDEGDRRNVVDAYRYWSMEAIVADLDQRRHPLHIAIENFENDSNIGTVVRTANAFLVKTVHIVGRKRWNRRGAMVTDRYQHLLHHSSVGEVVDWARENDLAVVAVDNVPGSIPIETAELPERCLLLFGQEGPGVTEEARRAADMTVSIAQFGSTRSINAGVAAGIAMHAWVRRYADISSAW
ncbi:TrmH family RNA methyltransferase [Corynebacterium lactis]|uniref:RNA methyltransferase n=1 Tax=Corynebacterium lactis RW2-5 TaxID=1408189 RepID=A0A0K2H2G8_9CORY|nr:RNA methyltransferase [Corynebacterium lactis]ALA68143.1 RNA methyltransferase [Corynebacterium lactis RW2-5]